ncbi:hypothetical protein GXM_05354 [Nostoc sphaeroides CCNUC1]|uniref:Uncharacterized protein n=1 Tax=Nostoc sphaeroides CCNUC1 TaxID=2653204 RepID=A0A5P8W5I1_9NOSO|nr:hypothetical protein GXM_05354 [Nostoc sphaeroides CCNUC1]
MVNEFKEGAGEALKDAIKDTVGFHSRQLKLVLQLMSIFYSFAIAHYD